MMKQLMRLSMLCSITVLLHTTGCMTWEEPPVPGAAASKISSPIKFDGELNDAAWSRTPGYEFTRSKPVLFPREAAVIEKDPFEGAVFKMLYDDKYLYVGCVLKDADICNDFTRDQTMLLKGGDLFEFFIAPAGTKPICYWEFYGAPNGLRSSYFYPSRGLMGIASAWDENKKNLVPGFAVKVKVNGTLNNHKDTDNSWTVEMRIPLKELEEKAGIKFAPGSKWRVLASRYNYGIQLNRLQNSAYPELPGLNYHLVEYYAPVEFR